MEANENTNEINAQTNTKEEDLCSNNKAQDPIESKDNCIQSNLNEFLYKSFTNKLNYLIDKYNIDSFSPGSNQARIFILNETIIALDQCNNHSTDANGHIRIRYTDELDTYETHFKNIKPETIESDDFYENEQSDHLAINFTKYYVNFAITRAHIHTLYAFDQSGNVSVPLVLFPRIDSIEPPNRINLIKNSASIEETQSGDLNNFGSFLKWLKLFAKQQKEISSSPIILILNCFFYLKLSQIIKEDNVNELKAFLAENEIYLVFYPSELKFDLNEKCEEIWNKILVEYNRKDNPNNQYSFLVVYKQTIRKLVQFQNMFFVKLCFNKLIEFLKLNLRHNELNLNDLNEQDLNEQDEVTQQQENIETEPKEATTSYKLNESETDDFCEWIDEMSKIGSLCIKYTFLRELYSKFKLSNSQVNNTKEVLANEKRWFELINKNKSKFKYSDSIGILNEKDYLTKQFDMDYFRSKYYNLVVNELKIDSADFIWTFDIIHFPFVLGTSLLKQPEKDYKERPRNLKPRISVLFAYSASGDYLQPYFVYPQSHFADEGAELGSNECLSFNGFVTCRIFENWLLNSFLPYVNNLKHVLLLYCGKLALIDLKLLTELKTRKILNSKLTFFSLTHENLIPFTYLFKKNLRKRQTDLFLDSWRKITSKQNLSYQFKLKSRQQFFNVFMDAFQNCIEEIGNEETNLNNNSQTLDQSAEDLNNSSVAFFKDKMSNSFEQCKLWPISLKDYKEHLENCKQNANAENKEEQNETEIEQKEQLSEMEVHEEEEEEEERQQQEQEQEQQQEEQEEEEQENIEEDKDDEIFEPSPKRSRSNPSPVESPAKSSLADLLTNDQNLKQSIRNLIKTEVKIFIDEIKKKDLNTNEGELLNDENKIENNKKDGAQDLIKDLLILLIENNSKKADSSVLKSSNKIQANNSISLNIKNIETRFDTLSKSTKSKIDLVRSLVQDLNIQPNQINNLNNVVNKLKELLFNFYTM